MKNREAVRRDIKFACKRSTTNIRTKLQKKCEMTTSIPVAQNQNRNKKLWVKQALINATESLANGLNKSDPSTNESEPLFDEPTPPVPQPAEQPEPRIIDHMKLQVEAANISHVIPTSKYENIS